MKEGIKSFFKTLRKRLNSPFLGTQKTRVQKDRPAIKGEDLKLVRDAKSEEREIIKEALELHRTIELDKQRAIAETEDKIKAIHRSTKTSFKQFSGVHNYLRQKSKLYYKWHLNPKSNLYNISALLAFFFATSFFMVTLYGPVKQAMASGSNCVWKGTSSTSWDTAGNWSDCAGGIPQAGDHIIFDSTASSDLVMTSDKTVAEVQATTANNFARTFNTNNYALVVNGPVTWQKGTLTAGNSTITVNSNNVELSGTSTFNYDTSTFYIIGSAGSINSTKDFYNLTVEKTDASTVVTLSTDLTVRGDLNITKGVVNSQKISLISDNHSYIVGSSAGGGTAEIEFNTATGSQYVVGYGGTLTTTTDVNKGGGVVYWNGSANIKNLSVTDGTLTVQSGKLTVPNDAAAGKISCAAGKTINFDGASAGRMVVLRSDVGAQQWDLDKNATCTVTADYLDLKDSNNTDAGSGNISITNGIDSGNNVGWAFSSTLAVKKWVGGTGGSETAFATAANWNPSGVPADSDILYFDSSSSQDCALDQHRTVAGFIDSDYTKSFLAQNFNLTVNGGFGLNGGTYNAGSSTLTVSGDANFSGGTFTAGTGTVTLTGTSSNLVSGASTLNSLNINKTGDADTLAVSGLLTLTGNLTLTNGLFNSGQINVPGNLTIASTFDGGTGTVSLVGTGVQAVTYNASAVMTSLNVNKTGGEATLSGNINIGGNLTVVSGAFTVGTNTVTLSGSGTSTFRPGVGTYSNITINKTGDTDTVSLFSSPTLTGNLVLTNGKVDSNTLNVAGNVTLASTFDGGSTALTLNGTGAQTYTISAGTMPSGTLTVNKTTGTATITATGNVSVDIQLTAGTLDFAGGYTYTITTGKTITTNAGTHLRFNGSAGNVVTLTSSNTWNLADSGSTYANYAAIDHSNNSVGTIYALNSSDGGLNTGWDFSSTAKTWDGGAGTLVWNDANNWNPDGAPDSNDPVTLDVASTITTSGDINFGSLTIGGVNTTVLTLTNNIGSGGDLTIAANGTFEQKNMVTQSIVNDILVQSGGTMTHTANGNYPSPGELYKLMVTAGNNFTVDAGGTINVTTKGYASQQGPGSGTAYGAGATYGGRGRNNTKSTYGSYTNPTDLGSGARSRPGGGAAILSAGSTLAVNGNIQSDGYYGSWWDSSGSGGSVNITAGLITGSGTISAAGQWSSGGNSGGGRIALNTSSISFNGTITTLTANSGSNSWSSGTIYLPPSLTNNLHIGTGGAGENYIKTLVLGTDDCQTQGNINDSNGTYSFGDLHVLSTGTLQIDGNPYLNSNEGTVATISATNITVDASGTLNTNLLGLKDTATAPGGGASGIGGTYGGRGYHSTKSTYGSYTNPISMGSPGTSNSGGGALILSVSGALTVNGTVSSNGGGPSGGGSAGSGGSVNITAGTVTGSGNIQANGVAGNSGDGGGGRIKLNATTLQMNGTVQALGSNRGSAGTVYLPESLTSDFHIGTGSGGDKYIKTLLLGTDDCQTTGNANDTDCSYSFGDLHILSTGTLQIDGSIIFNNNEGASATISATNLTVDASGTLNANSKGWRADDTTAPGYGAAEIGGTYGGKGGGPGGVNTKAAYGSVTNPISFGSGAPGGYGGGAAILDISSTLTINGSISADGGYNGGGAEAGSGGSVNITTGTLQGTGTIRAKGAGGNLGSGGGGRVAIVYTTNTSSLSSLSAGGAGNGESCGTIYTRQSAATNGDLLIDNENRTGGVTTPITVPLTFANIDVKNTGFLQLDPASDPANNTLTVTGTTHVYANSKIIFNTDHDGTPTGGAGITLTGATVTIDATGSINSDEMGFEKYTGPGGGVYQQYGGTYGGRGAGNSKATYGSLTNPVSVGSGGADTGTRNGGGAVIINSSGTVTNNGTISANATAASYSGSGGSVNIAAVTLTGSGTITANGGDADRGNGGGGRIGLGSVQNYSLTGAVKADGGLGDVSGYAGTVYLPESVRNDLQIGGVGNIPSLILGTDDQHADYVFGNITVNSGGALIVDGNPSLNSSQGGASVIKATNITVKNGGSLNANYRGFYKYNGPSPGVYTVSAGAYGGAGCNNPTTYGSAANPVSLGSGGGYSENADGGGAVLLDVSGTLDVQSGGLIQANSQNGRWNGSGGSIKITTANITGSGGINADAGTTDTCRGGGGRIAIYSTGTNSFAGSLTAAGFAAGTIVNNSTPAAPTLSLPADTATNQSQVVALTFSTTDPDGDWVRYKVEMADDSGFSQNLHTFAQGDTLLTQTVTDGGKTITYSGQDTQGGTGYASGSTATATIQSSTPLLQGHMYYWRVSAIDPAGVDSFDGTPHYSSLSVTRSFTVAPIDKTVYTAGATQTKKAGQCSAIYTFETRNSINETVKLTLDKTFNLVDSSGTGTFYSNAGCSSALPSNQVTISSGTSSASFYYKTTVSSTSIYNITASETPSEGWTDATTTIKINPEVLDHYTATGYPAGRTADQTFPSPIVVTAYDQYNNVKFDYTGKIWFTSSCDGYQFPSELPNKLANKYTFTGEGGDNGTHSFLGSTFRLKQVGTQTVTFHHEAYDNKAQDALSLTSSNITITPGEAYDYLMENTPYMTPSLSRYAVTGMTWDVGGAGEPYNIKVTVRDQFLNIKTDYTDRKIWFELYTSGMAETSHTFDYGTEGTAYTFSAGDAGIHTFSGTSFMSETAGKNMVFRARNESIHSDLAIYIKPLGLDHFTLTTSPVLSRGGTSWDQNVDTEWKGDDTDAAVTVTAYDTLGNVKVDYGYSAGTGEGMVYFYSPERDSQVGGVPLTNLEYPYIKTSASSTGQCFQFPSESSGVYTFTGESEIFKFFKGGRRTAYVAECIDPSSSYALDNSLYDPNFEAADPSKNAVKTGIMPSSSPGATSVATHPPGSTHENDQHTINDNNNFTIGPGDEKLILSWKNPFDVPVTGQGVPLYDPKVYIYQSVNGTDYTLLDSPRPAVNGASTWQSQEVTGLDNETPYWFKLQLGYKRPVGSYILSEYSIAKSGTPKPIAPVDVTASQLNRDDATNPGRVQVDYKLRFNSTTTFEYFNSSTLAWTPITDSAVSGDKGLIDGNFDNPISHTTYLEMNTDFDGQYLNGAFKIRVDVSVEGQGESNSESNLLTLDTKNPASPTLVIDATGSVVATLTISATDDSTPMKMMISNSATFDGASFEDYATTKSNYSIEGADHVYIKFRDLYYNDTAINTEIRPVPEHIQVKDASNIADASYRLVIIWRPTDGNDHYNIWRTSNGTDYTKIDTSTKDGYLDINLDHNLTYGYKVTSEDANHNISIPAGPVSAQPGAAPDVDSNPQVELFGWKQDFGVRAKVTWNTDQLSDSNVAYSTGVIHAGADMTADGEAVVKITADPNMTKTHEIWLYNLEASTKYYFKAFSKNEIQIAGYSGVLDFTTPEKIALIISGMKVSDVTMTGALVGWTTSKLSTTLLEYGTSPSFGSSITDTNMNTDHTFKLNNLESGTKYYLRVKATDSDENTTISDVYTFDTPKMPLVSGVTVSDITFNTATITWQSNVNADSNVEFGTDGTLSGTQGKADSTTVHSATLIGLTAKTTYSFRVRSSDPFGNVALGPTMTFLTMSDTVAPKISDVRSEVITSGTGTNIKYQAVISWTTDEPSTSKIDYSFGISGDYTKSTKEDLSLNSSHVVIVSDLDQNSAYHFRIESKDGSGNTGYSDDSSIITPPKEKSLLQIIIKTLEDTFSWVGKLQEKWGK